MIFNTYSSEAFPDEHDYNSIVCFSDGKNRTKSERFIRFKDWTSKVFYHQWRRESLHAYIKRVEKIKNALETYLERLKQERLIKGEK